MDFNKTLLPWMGKTTKMIGCFINEVLLENGIDLTREQWIILAKLHQKDVSDMKSHLKEIKADLLDKSAALSSKIAKVSS